MGTLTIPALPQNLDLVLNFVDEQLEQHTCSSDAEYSIHLAVEEIFENITNYAYPSATGDVTVGCYVANGASPILHIELMDSGTPYNPLLHTDPDASSPGEQCQEGGLGIFMVKSNVDHLSYRFENGQNIMTIEKKLQ